MDICVSTWSLRDHVGQEFPLSRFGHIVKERYHISAVEICQMHLVTYRFGFAFPACESYFLDAIRVAMLKDNIKIVNVPVDVGNISQIDARSREFDMNVVKGWLDAAKYLGSEAVRVNTESVITREDSSKVDIGLVITKESFKELASYAEELDIQLLLENHGGLSSNPDSIIELVEAVANDHFGICADLGNFSGDIRYKALEKLAPYTKLIHAKTYDFNQAGEMKAFDFRECLRIFKRTGYDGYVSIEFEGKGDQWQGVSQTLELITKSWDNV